MTTLIGKKMTHKGILNQTEFLEKVKDIIGLK